jgi:iron complex outermembrane receptor protein
MFKLDDLQRAYRVAIWVLAVSSLGALTAHAATATFEIEPQELSGALKAFAVQSHREIFFGPELARGKTSKGVKGKYDDLKALSLILEGTGLEFSVTPSDAILVRDPAGKNESSHLVTPPPSSANSDPNPQSSAESGVSGAQDDSKKSQITEIIVTAQKKAESLQNVPVPVLVLDAGALVAQNQLRLQDYYASVPGFTVLPADQNGAATLAIRGITTGGFANPTVGIVIDDVPYGSSTGLSGGSLAPDIDPSDLARVEVLRGPQGTLYGASSLGGLIKFVTVDPSTDTLSGRIQADANTVQNGAELGIGVRGAVNVPITDTLAIRASAFGRLDPGYIDDPFLHIDGINKDVAYGARLAALWRPSDTLSAKFSALYQDIHSDGNNDVFMAPGYSDLEQNYPRGVGAYDRRAQSYSLTLNAKFGSVDLTSLSGYSVNSLHDSYDYTPFLGTYTQTQFGVKATPLVEDNKTDKFTQEVRLSTPIGPYVDWLFGVFYTHERSPYVQNVYAQSPAGAFVGQWVSWNWGTTYAEYAGFTDITFHITDRFDLQVGGRESHNRQTYSEVDTGPYVQLAGSGHERQFLHLPGHAQPQDFVRLDAVRTARVRVSTRWPQPDGDRIRIACLFRARHKQELRAWGQG